MMNSRIYPIGIQNFEKIRKSSYLYVDKTALIYQLISTGSYYFLSRPRRFGKSLLISTMQAYFEGKRELFEGLAIDELEKEWVKRPVLHIDLNTQQYDSASSLRDKLNRILVDWEKRYGSEPAETSLPMRFEGVIQRACEQTGHRVAILVDEYDKPMLQAIGDEPLQEEFRNILKSFYGALKSKDQYIKFGFLTGVTKFSHVSIFSDLNNLNDLSRNGDFATLCGITEEELYHTFDEDIRMLAAAQRMTYEECCVVLRKRYDGYHFNEDCPGIYNPFSLLNTFFNRKFNNYWFATGTPSYLVELLRKHNYNLYQMAHEETNADVLDSIDSTSSNPIPIIYQSGYLTIKDYDPEFGIYRLGFPNLEVEEGFTRYLLPFYTCKSENESSFEIRKFVREIESGDIDAFFNRLSSFFCDIPYDLSQKWDLERHYQNVLFIIFKLIGLYVKTEYRTAEGRIDLVLETNQFIYIMEFKLEGTAEEALKQINDKHYSRPFEADKRRLFLIGVNFSKELRNIEKWVVE